MTTVIKLTTKPAAARAAAACASSIIGGQVEEHRWGTVDYISPEDIRQGNWNAVQFTSNELYRTASQELWGSTLKNQVVLGPQGSMIRTGTDRCRPEDVGATPALYNHNVEHCNRLEVSPDCYVRPKSHKPSAANTLRRANYLKFPERVRLTTVKNMVCRTTQASVGSAWVGRFPPYMSQEPTPPPWRRPSRSS